MNQKKLTLSFLYYLISAFGISLTLKANIGVSSFNALNATLAEFSEIKIGTITAALNFLFLIGCFCLDPQLRLKNYLPMSAALLFFGSVINFFTYMIFPLFTLHSYFLNLILFVLGTVIAGIGTGKVLKYQTLKFPIETFCLFLAGRTRRSFKFYRYGIDLSCILIAIGLTLSFHLTLMVREGTLISFCLLSPLISIAKD